MYDQSNDDKFIYFFSDTSRQNNFCWWLFSDGWLYPISLISQKQIDFSKTLYETDDEYFTYDTSRQMSCGDLHFSDCYLSLCSLKFVR